MGYLVVCACVLYSINKSLILGYYMAGYLCCYSIDTCTCIWQLYNFLIIRHFYQNIYGLKLKFKYSTLNCLCSHCSIASFPGLPLPSNSLHEWLHRWVIMKWTNHTCNYWRRLLTILCFIHLIILTLWEQLPTGQLKNMSSLVVIFMNKQV